MPVSSLYYRCKAPRTACNHFFVLPVRLRAASRTQVNPRCTVLRACTVTKSQASPTRVFVVGGGTVACVYVSESLRPAAAALTVVPPNLQGTLDWLLHSPVAVLALTCVAVFLVPRIAKTLWKKIVLPLAFALIGWIIVQNPNAALGLMKGILAFSNLHPVAASLAILGVAGVFIVPYLLPLALTGAFTMYCLFPAVIPSFSAPPPPLPAFPTVPAFMLPPPVIKARESITSVTSRWQRPNLVAPIEVFTPPESSPEVKKSFRFAVPGMDRLRRGGFRAPIATIQPDEKDDAISSSALSGFDGKLPDLDMKSKASSLFSGAKSAVSKSVESVKEGTEMAASTVNSIEKSRFVAAARDALDETRGNVSDNMPELKSKASDLLTGAKSAVSKGVENAKEGRELAASTVSSIEKSRFAAAARDALEESKGKAAENMPELKSKAASLLTGAKSAVSKGVENAREGGELAASTVSSIEKSRFAAAARDAFEESKEKAADNMPELKSKASNMLTGAKSAIAKGVETVKEGKEMAATVNSIEKNRFVAAARDALEETRENASDKGPVLSSILNFAKQSTK